MYLYAFCTTYNDSSTARSSSPIVTHHREQGQSSSTELFASLMLANQQMFKPKRRLADNTVTSRSVIIIPQLHLQTLNYLACALEVTSMSWVVFDTGGEQRRHLFRKVAFLDLLLRIIKTWPLRNSTISQSSVQKRCKPFSLALPYLRATLICRNRKAHILSFKDSNFPLVVCSPLLDRKVVRSDLACLGGQ